VAPIDGKEYADHHRGANKQHARSEIKKGNRLAVRGEYGMAKRPKAAGSSKVRNI
jgi:ribosomal protein L44E